MKPAQHWELPISPERLIAKLHGLRLKGYDVQVKGDVIRIEKTSYLGMEYHPPSMAPAYIMHVTQAENGIVVDADFVLSPLFYIFILGMLAIPLLMLRQMPGWFYILGAVYLYTASKIFFHVARRQLQKSIQRIIHMLDAVSADSDREE